jgi:hypothetical protein
LARAAGRLEVLLSSAAQGLCPERVPEGTREYESVRDGTREYERVRESTRWYPRVRESTRAYPRVPESSCTDSESTHEAASGSCQSRVRMRSPPKTAGRRTLARVHPSACSRRAPPAMARRACGGAGRSQHVRSRSADAKAAAAPAGESASRRRQRECRGAAGDASDCASQRVCGRVVQRRGADASSTLRRTADVIAALMGENEAVQDPKRVARKMKHWHGLEERAANVHRCREKQDAAGNPIDVRCDYSQLCQLERCSLPWSSAYATPRSTARRRAVAVLCAEAPPPHVPCRRPPTEHAE